MNGAFDIDDDFPVRCGRNAWNGFVLETDYVGRVVALKVLRIQGPDEGVVAQNQRDLVPRPLRCEPPSLRCQVGRQPLDPPEVYPVELLPVADRDFHLWDRVSVHGACW